MSTESFSQWQREHPATSGASMAMAASHLRRRSIYIKAVVFEMYPLETQESEKMVRNSCVPAIIRGSQLQTEQTRQVDLVLPCFTSH